MTTPRVLILVGGFGTRLQKVVSDVPKPMAPIAGRPFLEYQIEYLKRQGFTKFTFLTGYMSEVIESHFGDGRKFGVEVDYSVEKEPMGTGGAIRMAMENSKDDSFIAMNGDSLFATDYNRFVDLAEGRLSIALKYSTDLSRYGAVEIDDQSRITSFKEKSAEAVDGYLNAGTYFIPRSAILHFPKGKFSIETEVFRPLAERKGLFGVPCGGKFVDIGTPESFAWAQDHMPQWLREEFHPCLFLDRDGTLIEHVNYLHKPEDVRLVPQVVEMIREAKAAGWYCAVVTNQSGVGRGMFKIEDCDRVHSYIDEQLAKSGLKIDSWKACYSHPTEGNGEYKRSSLLRKPGPGMLLEICEELPIDLRQSLMVGDNSTDQIELPDLETWLIKGSYELNLKPGNLEFEDAEEMLSEFKLAIQ